MPKIQHAWDANGVCQIHGDYCSMADGGWVVLGCDKGGVTVEARGDDPEALADTVAPWAQQEEDRWPEFGLVYMLVRAEDVGDRPDLPMDVLCPDCGHSRSSIVHQDGCGDWEPGVTE